MSRPYSPFVTIDMQLKVGGSTSREEPLTSIITTLQHFPVRTALIHERDDLTPLERIHCVMNLELVFCGSIHHFSPGNRRAPGHCIVAVPVSKKGYSMHVLNYLFFAVVTGDTPHIRGS
jgi:hypothetical protein